MKMLLLLTMNLKQNLLPLPNLIHLMLQQNQMLKLYEKAKANWRPPFLCAQRDQSVYVLHFYFMYYSTFFLIYDVLGHRILDYVLPLVTRLVYNLIHNLCPYLYLSMNESNSYGESFNNEITLTMPITTAYVEHSVL